MTERDQPRDAERLPEPAAQRLLVRAGEIEAARGAELTVAELREVAREAGIAPSAFEQALSELRGRDASTLAATGSKLSRLRRLARFWPAALMLGLLLSILFLRLIVSPT